MKNKHINSDKLTKEMSTVSAIKREDLMEKQDNSKIPAHENKRIKEALNFYEAELAGKIKYFWIDYLDLLDSGKTMLMSIINAVHYGMVLGYKFKENEEETVSVEIPEYILEQIQKRMMDLDIFANTGITLSDVIKIVLLEGLGSQLVAEY